MSHEIHKLTREKLVFSPRSPPSSSRQGAEEATGSGWLRLTEGLPAVLEGQLGIPPWVVATPPEVARSLLATRTRSGRGNLAGGNRATGHGGQRGSRE
jgi:hypothetical protein